MIVTRFSVGKLKKIGDLSMDEIKLEFVDNDQNDCKKAKAV